MSRDITYLFAWETLPYSQGAPAPLARAFLESRCGTKGRVLYQDDFTLIWECYKHGLLAADMEFEIQADQCLERADGGVWELNWRETR